MTIREDDPRLTAYALGELHGEDLEAFERLLEADPDARAHIEEIQALGERVVALDPSSESEVLDPLRKERVLAAGGPHPVARWRRVSTWATLAAACLIAIFAIQAMVPLAQERARNPVVVANETGESNRLEATQAFHGVTVSDEEGRLVPSNFTTPEPIIKDMEISDHVEMDCDLPFDESLGEDGLSDAPFTGPANNGLIGLGGSAGGAFGGRGGWRIHQDQDGPEGARYSEPQGRSLRFPGGEGYDAIQDNRFFRIDERHTSTFSIDVDTASYANVRRFLEQEGRLPPRNAVRIEELLNYFPYDYAPPRDDAEHPFIAHSAVAACPWAPKHRLVRIALKGKVMQQETRPAANLVFLLDVSGSMSPSNKLPLVKQAMRLLVDQLEARDRVAIVVYAGAAGCVLPSTTGDQKSAIHEALLRLKSGGSTNGGAGIQLAYDIASRHFVKGGVNRVILCTDGDFNVGISDRGGLTGLIEEKAKSGVYLSLLGFGMGNLKDGQMEELSNKGNGNYAYVDSLREAQKVLVDEGLGTLVTIAKDVKIQIFFNPARVAGWRLIGYENRQLKRKDFNDDTKDAGEIGAGHAVTALYEIVPVGVDVRGPTIDPNPFVAEEEQPPVEVIEDSEELDGIESSALLRLRLRYKQPDEDTSTLMEQDVSDSGLGFEELDEDFQWAAAVAGFGMMLRKSPHKGQCSWPLIEELASGARGTDARGHRAECLQLIRLATSLSR